VRPWWVSAPPRTGSTAIRLILLIALFCLAGGGAVLNRTGPVLVSPARAQAPDPGRVASPPVAGETAGGPSAAALRVEPGRVLIGFTYGGTGIRAQAMVPEGMAAAVLLEGARTPLDLKKKGKVAGILWMNVGDVEFRDVPEAYVLVSSAPLRTLAPREELRRLGLGYEALLERSGGDSAAFRDLIRLKSNEGVYSIDVEEAALEPDGGGSSSFSAVLPLSSKAPQGSYQVRLYGFAGGSGRCLATVPVQVEQAGPVRLLHGMAMHHGLLYGCTAVVISLLAGLATGLIFDSGASRGH